MLEVLRIRNIAIIDSADIPFTRGLNIISGETGAGKSIVIEAISLLLGGRASVGLIRTGCDEAIVEGLFDLSEILWMQERLRKFGFTAQTSELLVKRTVHRAGRHRIFVNGELATMSTLQELCEGLIDLCGQSEHQSLLKSGVQLDLLDRYCGLTERARAVSGQWLQFRHDQKELDKLQTQAGEESKRADFLRFKMQEIQAANLGKDEEESLQKEKQLLQSADFRALTAESVRSLLDSEEVGVLNPLRAAQQKLKSLVAFDPGVDAIAGAVERALIEAQEASLALSSYLNSIELDPQRLQEVQDRLSLIADLRRKYGGSLHDVLRTYSELEAEMDQMNSGYQRAEDLRGQLKLLQRELESSGLELSKLRSKGCQLLADSVTEELKDLKMGEAVFSVQISTKSSVDEWGAQGADSIQFVVQTNRGEPARALGRIASGGELSRLMLAIRRVISDRGGIGVYLFDEIDAGIGGQTAFQVGKKLKSVASYNQVICITHLPQVASFADHHLSVRKRVHGNRTSTEVHALNSGNQREEIARMLGGPELTKKSLDNASELLELARLG
jgi:DNA repair protein RecN (Recombination protein N)